MRTGQPITVRMLCGTEELAGIEVAAGEAGLDQEVHSLAVISTLSAAESVAPGALVIISPAESQSTIVDLLLRSLRAAGATALVLRKGPHSVRSTYRLADKLGLPLLMTDYDDPLQLARKLDAIISAPELLRAEALNRLVRRLSGSGSEPRPILDALSEVLRGQACLLSETGALIAGSNLDVPEGALEPPVLHTIALGKYGQEGALVLAPVTLDIQAGPDLWLAVRLPAGPHSWTTTAEQATVMAAWAMVAWASRRRVEGERDARERGELLASLLEKPGDIDARVAERVLQVGWRLNVWHTGVYLRSVQPHAEAPARFFRSFQGVLAKHGLVGQLIERADGWAFWLTAEREPPQASFRSLVEALRGALGAIADLFPLVAGVGRPYSGVRGLAKTLDEARQACLLAHAGAQRPRVAHIDELGLQRLLADWYASESFRTYAQQILKPLRGSGRMDLLRTVEAYLEHESSASSTASALGVHRNTVAERIARAEELLAVNLSVPDHRLVIQLACRTLRFDAGGEPPNGAAGRARGGAGGVSSAEPVDSVNE